MIILEETDFVGQGAHKKCYIHPEDSTLCVKVLFQEPDTDLDRELAYRKSRQRRALGSNLLPKYLGAVDTNLGTGYVYERVCDFDGSNSCTLDEFIKNECLNKIGGYNTRKIIVKIQKEWFKERIITSNVELANFLVQKNQQQSILLEL